MTTQLNKPGIKIIWVVQKVFEVEYSLDEVKSMLESAGYETNEGVPSEQELRDALDASLEDDFDNIVGDNGPSFEDYKPFLSANLLKDEDFKDEDEAEEQSSGT